MIEKGERVTEKSDCKKGDRKKSLKKVIQVSSFQLESLQFYPHTLPHPTFVGWKGVTEVGRWLEEVFEVRPSGRASDMRERWTRRLAARGWTCWSLSIFFKKPLATLQRGSESSTRGWRHEVG